MDEVDEWFYDSIKRYNKLQMFTLDEHVNHIELSPDANNICVSNMNMVTKRCQILEYALPLKFLDTDDSLCSTDHNLKIRCGTYVDQLVLEMKVLASSDQIVTSEKNQSGVNIYSYPKNGSDKITKIDHLDFDAPEPPHISTCSQSDNLLCLSQSSSIPISVVDLNTKCSVVKMNLDCDLENNAVKTIFVDSNSIGVCSEQNGHVRMYDLRCPDEVMSSTMKDKPRGRWTMSMLENSDTLNLLSSDAQVLMFNIRNLNKPIFNTRLHIKNTNLAEDRLPQIETCPYDTNQFSVSGFDENVHIFSKREETLCDEVFTHDAHPYQEHCDKRTRVLYHKWMPKQYERMLMSSADNCSFSCVQYNSRLIQ
uniref:WD repeat-containing protein 73 n=1 Tax=Cacopsylla melanoneura TaxID=428564 RepID=A0A8D9AHZ9_9HEMI